MGPTEGPARLIFVGEHRRRKPEGAFHVAAGDDIDASDDVFADVDGDGDGQLYGDCATTPIEGCSNFNPCRPIAEGRTQQRCWAIPTGKRIVGPGWPGPAGVRRRHDSPLARSLTHPCFHVSHPQQTRIGVGSSTFCRHAFGAVRRLQAYRRGGMPMPGLTESDTIPLVVLDTAAGERFAPNPAKATKVISKAVDNLKDELTQLISSIIEVVGEQPTTTQGLKLAGVNVGLTITAQGSIGLATAGVDASLTIRFEP